MQAARLFAVIATHGRRRRSSVATALTWIVAFAPAAGLALLVQRGDATLARTLWLLLTVGGAGATVLVAPYLLYWWPEATLLARLPIDGRALYGLAVRRMLRGSAPWLCLHAAAAGALVATGAVSVWPLAVGVGCVLGASFATPALGALAGVLATSQRVRNRSRELGLPATGEAPQLFWLSFLPALVGIGVGIAALPATRWSLGGGDITGLIAALAVAGGGVVAMLAGTATAPYLPAATRDVAAMDAAKLATLQLDRARGLEALVGDLIASGGRFIYEKDVALARRRYPLFYLGTGLCIIIAWSTGFFGAAETREAWALGLVITTGVYLAVFGARLATQPIEQQRLLAILPITGVQHTRAKLAFVVWRGLWLFVLIAPAAWKSGPTPRIAAALAVALAAMIVAGLLAVRRRR